MSGILYLCATPIGNLGDITYRALEILKEVDLIAAEDTRHTMKLLNYFEIDTKTTSYHEHNKYDKGKYIISQLMEGKNIALVTDAGTPGISDPGEELVKMCCDNNIQVTGLPGAVAGIVALIISGLPTRRFVFEGFLPTKKKERKAILETLEKETRTIILYESPHRLTKTLEELYNYLGNREISICKELTKKYENIYRDNLEKAIKYYEINQPKGEYVLIIKGINLEKIQKESQNEWNKISVEDHMEYYLKKEYTQKEAMKQVAKDRGLTKRDIYQLVKVR